VRRRETMSGSWLLQVVDTAEKMVNVAFTRMCSINHRRAARIGPYRYAEHFWTPCGYMGTENHLDEYCS
jgi:hypothetical protein